MDSYYNSGILYASPNSPFEATFDSIYTGGESGSPTFRISIIDTPTGDYFLEPTSIGIYEKPEGSGIYAWAGTSPLTTGRYTIYWDDGGNPPEVYAVEDFIVTGQPLLYAAGSSSFIEALPKGSAHIVDMKNVGPPSTPQEIKRLRRQTGDMLRRYGQSVVHRHMYTLDDVDKGVAKKCPSCFDDAYSQVRNNCPVCFSIGFVSVENDPERFLDGDGNYTYDETSIVAPKYGGFAEPTLTLVMQPDVPIDLFKIGERGVLTRVEHAKAFSYFTPIFADNDLLIAVEVAVDGYSIKNILDYYQAKQTSPRTVRGWGKRGRDKKRFIVTQEFEMALVPPNNVLHQVSPGKVEYGIV